MSSTSFVLFRQGRKEVGTDELTAEAAVAA